MAKGPICIITPGGMVCSSSKPMKRHFPKEAGEPATPQAGGVYQAVDGALKTLIPSSATREVYCTIAQLMAQVGVTDEMAFTVTATMDASAKAPEKGAQG